MEKLFNYRRCCVGGGWLKRCGELYSKRWCVVKKFLTKWVEFYILAIRPAVS